MQQHVVVGRLAAVVADVLDHRVVAERRDVGVVAVAALVAAEAERPGRGPPARSPRAGCGSPCGWARSRRPAGLRASAPPRSARPCRSCRCRAGPARPACCDRAAAPGRPPARPRSARRSAARPAAWPVDRRQRRGAAAPGRPGSGRRRPARLRPGAAARPAARRCCRACRGSATAAPRRPRPCGRASAPACPARRRASTISTPRLADRVEHLSRRQLELLQREAHRHQPRAA